MVVFEAVPLVLSMILTFAIYPRASAEFSNIIFKMITLVVLFLGYHFLFSSILLVEFYLRNRALLIDKEPVADADKRIIPLDKGSEKKVFFLVLGLCLICYLPYFLYEFPGIMTADSLVQYQQIIGKTALSNHHPVAHTLLIKFFYNIGMHVTNRPEIAISFYTVFQMIFISLCHAVAVVEVMRIIGAVDRFVLFICALFYALLPFNAVFAVTIWKDVPFAGIAVLLSCQIIEMYRNKEKGIKTMDFCLFAALGVLFSLFRSNGWYVFLVFAPVFIYFFRDYLKKALLTAVISIVLVVLVKGPVFDMLKVQGPDFIESLSLPLQQVARVLVENGNVSDADLAMIDECIDRTYIKELYAPSYADNIKELFRAGNPKVIEDNKMEYLGLYLRLLVKNPGKYIRAFYDLEGGYFYPDVAYKVGDIDGIMANEEGLYSSPIIGGSFIKVKEILIKLSDFMPIYGMFFSIGAYTWLLIICLFVSVRRKEPIPVHVLMLLLVLTLLVAAPVVDFRYAYAIVLTMPIWVSLAIKKVLFGEKGNGRTDSGVY